MYIGARIIHLVAPFSIKLKHMPIDMKTWTADWGSGGRDTRGV